jgi:indole-3-glycerol phosphate synthase
VTNTLAEICARRREDVAQQRQRRPMETLAAAARAMPPPRGFAAALHQRAIAGDFALIAEFKRASPSKGPIRAAADAAAIAAAYARAGAACLSVLTEPHVFEGSDEDLARARQAAALPILRKDFFVDPYQVAEARAIGADCILIILAAVDDRLAAELAAAAITFGLDVLAEVHDEADLERALALPTTLIGINNRNLKTLAVDLATSERLAPRVPKDRLVIGESGIRHHRDLRRLAAVGVRCFLVGEGLMAAPDVEAATRALLHPSDHPSDGT